MPKRAGHAPFVLLGFALLAAPFALAHAAPPPPAYQDRLLHDCMDDYQGGDATTKVGHDVHALDMWEHYDAGLGEAAITFSVISTRGYPAGTTDRPTLTIRLTFEAGGKAQTVTAGVCLVAIGRGPVTDGLGLEEAGAYEAAERCGRRAVELDPTDTWAIHAVCHVMEMQGRPREGVAWVGLHEAEWQDKVHNFANHVWWHQGLFHLELDEVDAVLDLYDRRLWKEPSQDHLDIDNAVAMLMRLEFRGIDVGDRWESLAEICAGRTADQVLPFADAHFMLALIHGRDEQADALELTLGGRLLEDEGNARLGGLNLTSEQLQGIDRVVLTACGTSWHAALIGDYMLEELARIPAEVEYASEVRYRNPLVDQRTMVIGISQSGETADTLAAIREAKRRGAHTLGIVNVVGSTIAREVGGGIYIHSGPEIGVASTKAFTGQVGALALLTLRLGRLRSLSVLQGREIVQALKRLPGQLKQVLARGPEVERIAEQFARAPNALYLGRGVNFPVALEGALKLKEISYIHAEGYPAAEIKHGPIALIDEMMPVVFIAPRDAVYQKILSNVQEVKARRGRVIAVVTEGDAEITALADHSFTIPQTLDSLTPLLSVLPLQLLAYYIAVRRGCDVDKPRNLAKSVTVE